MTDAPLTPEQALLRLSKAVIDMTAAKRDWDQILDAPTLAAGQQKLIDLLIDCRSLISSMRIALVEESGFQQLEIRKREAAEAALAAMTEERDRWRNERHAFEADLFVQLQVALDHPDDAAVPNMVTRLIQERDRLRYALVKVRAHTGCLPGADRDLLVGLLASIERIADAALLPHWPTTPEPPVAAMTEERERLREALTKILALVSGDEPTTPFGAWIALAQVAEAALAPREEPRP